MLNRIWFRRFIRLVIVLIFLAWPMLRLDLVFPMQVLILGVILAYGGADDILIAYWVLLALGVELLYGMDIGLLSLAFALTVSIFLLLGRWISLKPLSRERGWSPSSFLRTLVVSMIALNVILFMSVLVGTIFHGHTSFASRISLEMGSVSVFSLEIFFTIIVLTLLRWADEPLRRHITFGI